MTFSIVAFDQATGGVGAAVASKFLAVGSIVPWVAAETGAIATQALCNASFGPEGLRELAENAAAPVLERLLAGDDRPERRQVGLVDVRGTAAAHTGTGNQPWAGHRTGAGYACQGNCLSGAEVLDAMASTFENSTGLLQDRLFLALQAGEKAGGDRRGRQSAAIHVARRGGGYQGLGDTVVDLRVDDAANPLAELGRLMDLHRLYLGAEDRDWLPVKGTVAEELRAILQRADATELPQPGWSDTFATTLDRLVGRENLEERFDLEGRRIDRRALDHLRSLYGRT